MTDTEDIEFDIVAALGADDAFSVQRFSIYLPNKDRNNRPVADIDRWVETAMALLVDINGGVTKLPTAAGRFRYKDDAGEEIIVGEDTVVIYSYVFDPAKFVSQINRIKAFLDSFGKLTDQHTVMVEFSGEDHSFIGTEGTEEAGAAVGFYMQAYNITKYPEAADVLPWTPKEQGRFGQS